MCMPDPDCTVVFMGNCPRSKPFSIGSSNKRYESSEPMNSWTVVNVSAQHQRLKSKARALKKIIRTLKVWACRS